MNLAEILDELGSRQLLGIVRIDSDVALIKRVILDLESYGVEYSVNDIVNRYRSPRSNIPVLDHMRSQAERMRASNRHGTAKNYEKTISSFGKYLGNVRLPLSALTEQVITDYNAFLVQRGLVRNSVSFYMRVLRAIYNKTARQKLIEQQHPFTEVYTGIDRTRKRAVSESIIFQLHRLELEAGTPLALCRDMFIFSYCTRGMAFVDIAVNGNQKCSDFGNSECSIFGIKTTVLLASAVQ